MHDVARLPGRIEIEDARLSHRLGSRESGHALRALVEEQDLSVQVGGDDAVGGGVDQPLEKLLGLAQLGLELAAVRDVAEAEDGAAVLRTERSGRDREHRAPSVAGEDAQVRGEHPPAARQLACHQRGFHRALRRHQVGEEETACVFRVRAENGAASRVHRHHPACAVEDRHAVVDVAEELLVAAQLRQLALGGHPLLALAAEPSRVAQSCRRGAGHRGEKSHLARREPGPRPRADEDHADHLAVAGHGNHRDGADALLLDPAAHRIEQRMALRVVDDQRGAGDDHLADLRIEREIDLAAARFRLVAGGHHRPRAVLADQQHRAALDGEPAGDPRDDLRKERLRLAARERVFDDGREVVALRGGAGQRAQERRQVERRMSRADDGVRAVRRRPFVRDADDRRIEAPRLRDQVGRARHRRRAGRVVDLESGRFQLCAEPLRERTQERNAGFSWFQQLELAPVPLGSSLPCAASVDEMP